MFSTGTVQAHSNGSSDATQNGRSSLEPADPFEQTAQSSSEPDREAASDLSATLCPQNSPIDCEAGAENDMLKTGDL